MNPAFFPLLLGKLISFQKIIEGREGGKKYSEKVGGFAYIDELIEIGIENLLIRFEESVHRNHPGFLLAKWAMIGQVLDDLGNLYDNNNQ